MALNFGTNLFGKTDFKKGNVNLDSAGDLPVDIQNASIAITHTGNLDVEVKNAAAITVDASGSTVPISVAGTVTVDASGATVPISHTGDLDVNITNASMAITHTGNLDVNIAAAQTLTVTATNLDIDGDVNIKDVTVLGTAMHTSGFDGPRANQTPIKAVLNLAADSTWTTLYTVTTGKTAYITEISFANGDVNPAPSSIGVSSTEHHTVVVPLGNTTVISLGTPLKYTTATVIQGISASGATAGTGISIIGWEE